MKRILYIVLLFAVYGNAQVINRASRFPVDSFTPYPNQSNGNPELVTNDALAFGEEEVNAINISPYFLSNATVSAVDATGNGNEWNPQYAQRVTASSTGTLRRVIYSFSGLTNGDTYDMDIMYKVNDGQVGRWRFSSGAVTDHNTTFTNSTWVLQSISVTTNSTALRIDLFVANATANSGESVDYIISLKHQ